MPLWLPVPNKQGSFITGVLSAALAAAKHWNEGNGHQPPTLACIWSYNFRSFVLTEISFDEKSVTSNDPCSTQPSHPPAQLTKSDIKESQLRQRKASFWYRKTFYRLAPLLLPKQHHQNTGRLSNATSITQVSTHPHPDQASSHADNHQRYVTKTFWHSSVQTLVNNRLQWFNVRFWNNNRV